MAKLLTQNDVYAIINQMVEDVTGQTSSTRVVDTSSFVSAGETLLTYGTENVLNSLAMLMGRIFVAARPYKGKFDLINAVSTGIYTHRMAKISFYSKAAKPEGAWNTQLFTNLKGGFTNGQNVDATSGDAQSTKSMWEQNPAYPLEMNFAGSNVYEDCMTFYEVQVQQALRNEGEFNELASGMLTQYNNDLEVQKETWRRGAVLNHIGAVIDAGVNMPGSSVNLTAAFNDFYGTSYTTEELQSTYFKEFLGFFVSQLKIYSRKMENYSSNYHWTPAKTDEAGNSLVLNRHTPRSEQRLFMYAPFFTMAESMVFPEIFNDEYLKPENYEGVDFWQFENLPAEINVTPAIPDFTGATGVQTKGDAVNLTFVLGVLFDRDALMTDVQFERAYTTPIEARKLYYSTWMHYSFNVIDDLTEKSIVFYMADET